MADFVISLIVFAVLWGFMRVGREVWGKNKLPGWVTPIGGIIAWLTVLSAAGPFIAIVRLFARIVTKPNISQGYEFGAMALLGAGIAKLLDSSPEILDYDRVQPFLWASLKFQGYGLKHDNVFEELEKHEVRAIHKELTGKELIQEPKKKEPSFLEPEQVRKELELARMSPRSIHLKAEIDQLTHGNVTDVTDAFKLSAMRISRHRLYEECSLMKIDPATKTLSFLVRFPELTPDVELNPERVFRVKQDLYDLLQSVTTEHWIKPYTDFIETLSVTCHRVEIDSFNMPQPVPFMTVEIPLVELRKREGQLFVPSELEKIAKVTIEPKGNPSL